MPDRLRIDALEDLGAQLRHAAAADRAPAQRRRRRWAAKPLVIALAACALSATAVAATLIANGTLSVVDPEQAVPESISDPTQNQPPDPGKHPSIPVPTGIPPGPIGHAVDPDNPPQSSVPLPRPDEAIQAISAQVDNEPIDTAGATAGIAFRPRYFGRFQFNNQAFQVTILEASEPAKRHGLRLGAQSITLPDGRRAYEGPGDKLTFTAGDGIVTVTGGTSGQQRAEFATHLRFRWTSRPQVARSSLAAGGRDA